MNEKQIINKKALAISKKKIQKYLLLILPIWFFCTIALIISLIFFTTIVTEYLSMVLTIAFGLNLLTWAWIFDFGAAKKLRKSNFKVEGIANKGQGLMYYKIIKKIGIIRLLINIICLITPFVFALIIFI